MANTEASATATNLLSDRGSHLSEVAHAQFIEFYDFLVHWGGRTGAGGDAERQELEREIARRWLVPHFAISGEDDFLDDASHDPTFSALIWKAVAETLPNWFQAKVAKLVLPPTSYDFLLPAAGPNEIGTFAEYRVLRVLGEGGMGVVFEANLPEPQPANNLLKVNKRFAIKVIKPEKYSLELDTRFVQEAQILERLSCRNVVKVVRAARTNGKKGERDIPYIAMEFVEGLTLHDLIEHHAPHPVPLPIALDLIRQTARGLEAIHSDGAIRAHRDLKPANVLLERVGKKSDTPFGWHVRICDVGLALPIDGPGLTAFGYIVGTEFYRPPEQLIPNSLIDERCDIFALGIIAYEILTGRHPYNRDEGFLTPIPEMPEEIPQRVKECVCKMLELDREDRKVQAVEVVTLLDELLLRNQSSEPVARSNKRILQWLLVVVLSLFFVIVIIIQEPKNSQQLKSNGDVSTPPFTIAGLVRDATPDLDKNHRPIADAKVTLVNIFVNGQPRTTFTDKDGKYEFTDLPGDSLPRDDESQVIVMVQKDGYNSDDQPTKQSRNTRQHTIELAPQK